MRNDHADRGIFIALFLAAIAAIASTPRDVGLLIKTSDAVFYMPEGATFAAARGLPPEMMTSQ